MPKAEYNWEKSWFPPFSACLLLARAWLYKKISISWMRNIAKEIKGPPLIIHNNIFCPLLGGSTINSGGKPIAEPKTKADIFVNISLTNNSLNGMLDKGSYTTQWLLKHSKMHIQLVDLLHGVKRRWKQKADVKDRMHGITTLSMFYSFSSYQNNITHIFLYKSSGWIWVWCIVGKMMRAWMIFLTRQIGNWSIGVEMEIFKRHQKRIIQDSRETFHMTQ